MNELNPTSNQPQFSAEELERLIRQGDPPLTRRELRARERAEELGYLTRVGERLVIADPPRQQAAASSHVVEEPPSVTSADVLAGRVPAASGLTRRQLRELAAQHDSQEEQEALLEHAIAEPVHSEPAQPEASPPPETGATPRPVVHPPGVATGEYTGEFDKIRQAMADINAAPEQAPQAPARRSVFQASVPQELQEPVERPETPAEQTDAADWTAVIDSPTVTDDLLPELEDPEPEAEPVPEPVPEPERQASTGSVPSPGDDKYNFPDWHTLTSIPTVSSAPQSPNSFTHASTHTSAKSTPVWLMVLQWLVIAAVAVVLGLLVWYAINRGLGSGSDEAWGIITPAYYLRT